MDKCSKAFLDVQTAIKEREAAEIKHTVAVDDLVREAVKHMGLEQALEFVARVCVGDTTVQVPPELSYEVALVQSMAAVLRAAELSLICLETNYKTLRKKLGSRYYQSESCI